MEKALTPSDDPGQKQSAPPGLVRKAVNLAHSSFTHAVGGFKTLSEGQKNLRLAACRSCPSYDRSRNACQICGCNLNIKAGWADQHCPIGKWPGDPPTVGSVPPTRRTKILEGRTKSRDDAAFNSSLIRYNGRLLMAYRLGWSGAQCHLAELDESLRLVRTQQIPLFHDQSSHGREDPRLFLFMGQLHMAYAGIVIRKGFLTTNQMYARLAERDGQWYTEEVFYPDYPARQIFEKNWSFFGHDEDLYAVYSIRPHLILRVKGNRALPYSETPNDFPWYGGMLRGGASPVRVGDVYYHWFHGRHGEHEDRRYNIGVYAFEARPPFRILRQTPVPIYVNDVTTKPPEQYCPVVFPCGAVLEDGTWKVSAGVHDRWTEVLEWKSEDVEKALG